MELIFTFVFKRIQNLLFVASFLLISSNIFAQNVYVTNTNNSGSGSLRQAIIDANSNSAVDSVLFQIPTTDANYNTSSGVFQIEITDTPLPPITNNGLVIDGTSQTRLVGNTNTAILGSGAKVGVDQLQIPKVDGPEIEIIDGDDLKTGLIIHAHYVTIRGLSIYGFGNGFSYNADANILVKNNYTHFIIEKNIVGSPANQLARPISYYKNKGNNISASYEASYGIIRNNIVAYADNVNILSFNPDTLLIEYNEVFNDCYATSDFGIGLLVTCGVGHTIKANYIYGHPAEGFDFWDQTKYNFIVNNTVTGNGMKGVYTAGVRHNGADYSTMEKNIIFDNYGAGVMMTSGAYHITVTKNSIYGNGCVPNCDTQLVSHQIGIDNLSDKDYIKSGSFPFMSLNDSADWDAGGNTILNYPIIEEASIDSNGKLTVKGFARPGSLIEFFIGVRCDSTSCAQGKTYLFSRTEGSNDDKDPNFDYYCDCPINGKYQGTDKTNRFKFVLNAPNGLTKGDILTATATLDMNTSEFSCGTEVTNSYKDIWPMLYCMLDNGDGSYTAIYSYDNPNNDTINIPVGWENMMKNAPQNVGQPTVFYPGQHHDVFRYTFTGSSVTWKVKGRTITTYPTSYLCKADVSVTKYVDSPVVDYGDTVTFTIYAKNTSDWVKTNSVKLLDTMPDSLQIISYNASMGTYNPNTGEWNIGQLDTLQTAVLTIKAIVNGAADNCAMIISSTQKDWNTSNNKSCVSVCARGSSGGNDGGLESNGLLASKIALRNYRRITDENKISYNETVNLQPFTRELADKGIIGTASMLRNPTDLVDFIPDDGPFSTKAFVTTPSDLLGITNAVELISVDYFGTDDERYGAIYAVATNPGTVYEHTKLVCDRVNGANLEKNNYMYISSKPFIMNKLVHDNGDIDYAVSFVVYDVNGQFIIDNKWRLEDYEPIGKNEVYNFQVWSVNPQATKELVSDILKLIASKGSIDFINKTEPVIPQVYVTNGYYENGNLVLNIYNEIGARRLNIRGSTAEVEDGARTYFETDLIVPESQNNLQQVILPLARVFDVGFEVRNDATSGIDVLYFADGPWGIDYEKDFATITKFEITPQDTFIHSSDVKLLERQAEVKGQVKDYVSLFRAIRVGDKGTDLTAFKQLEFDAKGTGNVEVIIAKKSIKSWDLQYRKNIILTSELSNYKLEFKDFENTSGMKGFSAEDATVVIFKINGNKSDFQSFDLYVQGLQFNSNTVSVEEEMKSIEESFEVFPNPIVKSANVKFNISENNYIKLDIVDINGKIIKTIAEGNVLRGIHDYSFDSDGLDKGVYFCRLKVGELPEISKKIVHIE